MLADGRIQFLIINVVMILIMIIITVTFTMFVLIMIIVPTFDMKVTEYLCSGWVFFSSDKFGLFN